VTLSVAPVTFNGELVRLEPLAREHAQGLYNRGLEIGWTWLGQAWQRSGVNTEAKSLLLELAFERLGCARV